MREEFGKNIDMYFEVYSNHPLFPDVAGFRLGAFLSAEMVLLTSLLNAASFLFYFMVVEQAPCHCMYIDSSLGGDLLALSSKLNMALVSAFSKDMGVLRLLTAE